MSTRAYIVIDAGASRTVQQWNDLKGAVKNKPMLLKIRQLGEPRDKPHLKVIDSRLSLNTRFAFVRFIVDDADEAEALNTLNTQCSNRGITGNVRTKFTSLIQAELREAAIDLGYTAGQANNLVVTMVAFGNTANSIEELGTWWTSNAAAWE